MMLTWFVGVQGMNEGFTIASFLRSGTIPAGPVTAPSEWTMADLRQALAIEQLQALLAHTHVTFPLMIAETILAGLLVVASGLALSGRRGARSLALQAIGANAVLAVVQFALTAPVRAAYVDAAIRAVDAATHAFDTMTLPPEERAVFLNPSVFHWILRFKLLLGDLLPLALAVLALTRARTKVYFEAVARAAKSADDS
jgi:hypothetical protein